MDDSTNFKIITIRDKKYLDFIRKQPCWRCSKPSPSHAHHTETGGVGIKGSDYSAIPECAKCHRIGHDLESKKRENVYALIKKYQCIYTQNGGILKIFQEKLVKVKIKPRRGTNERDIKNKIEKKQRYKELRKKNKDIKPKIKQKIFISEESKELKRTKDKEFRKKIKQNFDNTDIKKIAKEKRKELYEKQKEYLKEFKNAMPM